nr:unnamed protein product [Callosobruchus analis]
MSETWLDDSISDDEVHINNYNFIRLDRGSRGEGVGFYIRSDLKYSILQKNEKIELTWVKVAIEDTSFALSVSYALPVKTSNSSSTNLKPRCLILFQSLIQSFV